MWVNFLSFIIRNILLTLSKCTFTSVNIIISCFCRSNRFHSQIISHFCCCLVAVGNRIMSFWLCWTLKISRIYTLLWYGITLMQWPTTCSAAVEAVCISWRILRPHLIYLWLKSGSWPRLWNTLMSLIKGQIPTCQFQGPEPSELSLPWREATVQLETHSLHPISPITGETGMFVCVSVCVWKRESPAGWQN